MRDSHFPYTGGRGIAKQFAQSLLASQRIALVCLELLLYIYQQQWGIPGLLSDFCKIIGDPSDPRGGDHAYLKAEVQDFVMSSCSVFVQSTIPALYRNTEYTVVTITSSFSGRDRTLRLSSFKAAKRRRISCRTWPFSAEKSPSMVLWTPRCLCGSSGKRTVKGSPLRVILSLAMLSPVFISTPTIFIFLSVPAGQSTPRRGILPGLGDTSLGLHQGHQFSQQCRPQTRWHQKDRCRLSQSIYALRI
jgi:hypothetical protein